MVRGRLGRDLEGTGTMALGGGGCIAIVGVYIDVGPGQLTLGQLVHRGAAPSTGACPYEEDLTQAQRRGQLIAAWLSAEATFTVSGQITSTCYSDYL